MNTPTFFSANCNLACRMDEPVPPPAAFCNPIGNLSTSEIILSPESAPLASVESKFRKDSVVVTSSRTISALKFCPLSASVINRALTSDILFVTTLTIVKSVLPEFSTILSVSAESDAVIFSPTLNVPATFVRTTSVPPVPSANTHPVAPEFTPLTCTPPLE